MSRSQRLQTVKRVAQMKLDQVAQQLAQSQAQLQRDEQQLQELENYQQEYQQQYLDAARHGMLGPQLISYQQFLAQLNAIIEQQQQVIVQRQQHVEACLKAWQLQYHRAGNLDNYIDVVVQEEQHEDEVRLQKELDDRRFSNPFDHTD